MNRISSQAAAIRSTLTQDTLNDTSIAAKRNAWQQHAQSVPKAKDITLEALTLNKVDCVLHSPPNCSPQKPIVYFHGGGLVEGSALTAREWCSRLAVAAKQSVLAVDYRLAPEHPYPAAVDDALAVCKAIQKSTRFKGISSIGADSTGCVLALRTLQRLNAAQLPQPASCFLLSPSIDLSLSGESITRNATRDPLVNEHILRHYAQLYATKEPLNSPHISPLFADLKDLSPILVHVDKDEIVLDDAKRLDQKVREHGGVIRLIFSEGLWHCWPTWGDFPEANTATDQIVSHIRTYQ